MKSITFHEFKELIESCKEVGLADKCVGQVTGYKEVFAEISSIFGSERISALHNLDQLLSELAIRSVTDGEPVELIFETIRALMDALKQDNANPSTVDDPWHDAIKLILKNQHLFFAYIVPTRTFPTRLIALANHVKTLQTCGYSVDILDGKPNISPEMMAQIYAEIDHLCKTLGGPTIVYNILRFISDTYDSRQQRYHLVRQLSTSPANNFSSPPWGLMLQMGVKQCSSEVEPQDVDQCMNDLIRLLTATVGLDGLEPSSIFDMLVQSDDSIIDFLRRAVMYDALYSLNQIRPIDAARMCHAIFDEWINLNNAIQIKGAINITDTIWDVSESQMPFAFKSDQLSNRTQLERNEINSICEQILAHGPDGPNQLLTLPLNPDSIDFGKKPLMRVASGGFCMVEKSLCSSNFLEAIFLAVLSSGNQLDIGKASEKFLRDALAEVGVKSKTGVYKIQKSGWDSAQQAECDAVIKTDKEILFLELKAKSLTRAAQIGDIHKLIDDLTSSLIDAHTQALKHELRLRTYGKLEFENGDTLVLGERKIERVVIAFSDFGCLHSRPIFHKFLSLCCRANFGSHSQADRFDKVNKKLDRMRVVLAELNKIGALNKSQPYWNSWFLSIPQILILLDHVECEKDFVTELFRLRAIVSGSFDFYREYETARTLLLNC